MKPFLFCVLALCVFALAPAEEPAEKSREIPMKRLENKDVPLEDLAHSFFFHSSLAKEMLADKISEEAAVRLQPIVADHKRTMHDFRKIAAKGARLCADLQRAASGPEFAAVFLKWEESERNERRQAARELLAKLDPHDRKALERFLDSEFRQSIRYSVIDYQAMFGSGPFPSPETTALMRRTCDDAAKVEKRVEP
jgi:hypothetical protein